MKLKNGLAAVAIAGLLVLVLFPMPASSLDFETFGSYFAPDWEDPAAAYEYALEYMNMTEEERRAEWYSFTVEERADLIYCIGVLEAVSGDDAWVEHRVGPKDIFDYFPYENLDAVGSADLSNFEPILEWVLDTYGQYKDAAAEILDQVLRGPNPDLPGIWSFRRPYGDIYSPNDRILDDLGVEYIKNPDGTWSATGFVYEPFDPALLSPDSGSAATTQTGPAQDATASGGDTGGDSPGAAAPPPPPPTSYGGYSGDGADGIFGQEGTPSGSTQSGVCPDCGNGGGLCFRCELENYVPDYP